MGASLEKPPKISSCSYSEILFSIFSLLHEKPRDGLFATQTYYNYFKACQLTIQTQMPNSHPYPSSNNQALDVYETHKGN